MNFFERQDQSRTLTSYLFLGLFLAYVAILIEVDLLIYLYFNLVKDNPYHGDIINNWSVYLLGNILVTFLIWGGALYRINALKAGGPSITESLGGKRLNTETTNLYERQLINVVDEMSIASGSFPPQVYVLYDDNSLNAFTAGTNRYDTTIAVTEGAIRKLSRSELQAVIAHEFSHIINGDTQLNIRLVGLIFGIQSLSIIGKKLLRIGRRSYGHKGRILVPLMGLSLFIIGQIGAWIGLIIKSAICRQREFLADASAVQFTRNPDSLAMTLKKIFVMQINKMFMSNTYDYDEIDHMLFSENSNKTSFLKLDKGHPPIEKRIKAIDSTFDLKRFQRNEQKTIQKSLSQTTPIKPHTITPDSSFINNTGDKQKQHSVQNSATLGLCIGQFTTAHLNYAKKLLSTVPSDLLEKAKRHPEHILYASLMSVKPENRLEQMKAANDFLPNNFAQTYEPYSHIDPLYRLPLFEVALAHLHPGDRVDIHSQLDRLMKHDGKYDLNEFLFFQIFLNSINSDKKTFSSINSYIKIRSDIQLVFSILIHAAIKDKKKKNLLFSQTMHNLINADLPFLKQEQCHVRDIRKSLEKIRLLTPRLKERAVNAMITIVMDDQHVSRLERDLIRVFCASIDVPVPPIIFDERD